MTLNAANVRVFSTCPQSRNVDRDTYLSDVVDVARWSEEAGCCGILVYSDNALVDQWLVSQIIIQSTESLSPLIAVQPVYMHPYTAATMVASLAFLHHRRVYLNMIAGGFMNDLQALHDGTPHDERYDRVVEYTSIVKALLSSPAPVTFEGRFYKVTNLRMSPAMPSELMPGILISGSSDAGLAAAAATGATAVKYPKPPGQEEAAGVEGVAGAGIRVGIIARESAEDAWRIARERFPEDRKGQLTHELTMKVSDSQWHRQLSTLDAPIPSDDNPYWLGPFQHSKTFCPYLVGTYTRVADVLSRYMSAGFNTFILDIPPSCDELRHAGIAFGMATGRA